MIKVNALLLAISVLVVLAGCGKPKTNDYTPAVDVTGEMIFSAACTECHTPVNPDVVMALSQGMAQTDAIIHQVQSGSMGMSAFPNIQGKAVERLAEYLLSKSTRPHEVKTRQQTWAFLLHSGQQ